jgi:hypothetical protein
MAPDALKIKPIRTNKSKSIIMENLSNLISDKNSKVPYPIVNMNPATVCPSKALGLCKLCNVCYAMKAEIQYPACLPYRQRQEKYWDNCTADQFVSEFMGYANRKRKPVTTLRMSEAGDFKGQADVNKLGEVANGLKDNGITTYCYTAREDLDLSKRGKLVINGSGFMVDNCFTGVKGAKEAAAAKRAEGFRAMVCGGDCSKCNACTKSRGMYIFVEIH